MVKAVELLILECGNRFLMIRFGAGELHLSSLPSSSYGVCVSEPKIDATDQLVLSTDPPISPITLQCNLTSTPSKHRESFWMKNGEEIPGSRGNLNNTEHRYD